MHPKDAKADLNWIHALPGTKVMIRGNHDYWWASLKKLKKCCHLLFISFKITFLKQMPSDASTRVVMTHCPPIGADLKDSRISAILEKYKISFCVFGHLHNIKHNTLHYGTKNHVKYVMCACDYVDFNPVRLM